MVNEPSEFTTVHVWALFTLDIKLISITSPYFLKLLPVSPGGRSHFSLNLRASLVPVGKPIIIPLIQHFEADFLWKVSLKILNSGIILKLSPMHVQLTLDSLNQIAQLLLRSKQILINW